MDSTPQGVEKESPPMHTSNTHQDKYEDTINQIAHGDTKERMGNRLKGDTRTLDKVGRHYVLPPQCLDPSLTYSVLWFPRTNIYD